jgi:hypothetical protein
MSVQAARDAYRADTGFQPPAGVDCEAWSCIRGSRGGDTTAALLTAVDDVVLAVQRVMLPAGSKRAVGEQCVVLHMPGRDAPLHGVVVRRHAKGGVTVSLLRAVARRGRLPRARHDEGPDAYAVHRAISAMAATDRTVVMVELVWLIPALVTCSYSGWRSWALELDIDPPDAAAAAATAPPAPAAAGAGAGGGAAGGAASVRWRQRCVAIPPDVARPHEAATRIDSHTAEDWHSIPGVGEVVAPGGELPRFPVMTAKRAISAIVARIVHDPEPADEPEG